MSEAPANTLIVTVLSVTVVKIPVPPVIVRVSVNKLTASVPLLPAIAKVAVPAVYVAVVAAAPRATAAVVSCVFPNRAFHRIASKGQPPAILYRVHLFHHG